MWVICRRFADGLSVVVPTVEVVGGATSTHERRSTMWDTVQTNGEHLTHDMPCPHCGHALHVYLECGDGCDCAPQQPAKRAELSVRY
jgi:hypothetical protein